MLWKSVFYDSEVYITHFISHFGIETCFVCEMDDKIVAMAFALPVTFRYKLPHRLAATIVNLKSKIVNLSLHYLYACATHPHYRRQGIMEKLLETIYNAACCENIAGIFLRAAAPDLANYYKKLGFEDFFYGNTFNHKGHKESTKDTKTFISPETYYQKRLQKLENSCFVNWDESFFRFLYETGTQFGQYGHEIFAFRTENEATIIDELLNNNIEESKTDAQCNGQIKWCNFPKPTTLNSGYFAFAME